MKTDTAQLARVAHIIRREPQLVKQYDRLFEAYERKRLDTYALRAELSDCRINSDKFQQANIRSWTLYENEQKENKTLRARVAHSTVKGIVYGGAAALLGFFLGKAL